MPTVLMKNGFRFFFYSNEGDEPIHIHVEKGDGDGKIWLEPALKIDYLTGFTKTEAKQVAVIVFEYHEEFKKQWHEYFDQ
jgi:hypothetical protein